jgi:uncharacterized membrane protein
VRQAAQLTSASGPPTGCANGMGSWTFVFAALVFLAGWMIGDGSSGFGSYPFILLSCLAAMQGAIS